MKRTIRNKPAKSHETCFYCGERATGYDHVVPYCIAGQNTDLVPCCVECNCLLGSSVYADVWEKKSYIAHKLPVRYRKELKVKASLHGLEGMLRKELERAITWKEIILDRIEFAQNNPIDKPDSFDGETAWLPLKAMLDNPNGRFDWGRPR